MEVESFSPMGALAGGRGRVPSSMCLSRNNQWIQCSRQESLKQFMVGFMTLCLVQIFATLIFGMVISSFFGWNLFAFDKTTNRYIWGGLIAFIIFTIGWYVYNRGFTGLGAKTVTSSVNNITRVNQQLQAAAFDPTVANRFQAPAAYGQTTPTLKPLPELQPPSAV